MVNKVISVSLCAETIKLVFEGGQNVTAVQRKASVYQVNPVSRITGERRVEVSRSWGPGFEEEGTEERGRREVGAGRAGQLNLSMAAINSTL